jgi:hypothetical protein
MNLLFTLLAYLLRSIVVVVRPGGCRSIIAENLLLKQQLSVLNRARKRAPNLPPIQRLFFAVWCQLLKRSRIERAAIVVRPSTLFRIHATFVRKKYRDLFSSKPRLKPGPKGPSPEVIQAILDFSAATLGVVALASLNRFPMLSVSPSTKTWFAESWKSISSLREPTRALLG